MCMGGFKNPALFLHWLIFGLQVRNVPFPSAWNNYIIPVLASLWKPIKNCETGRRSRPRLSASVIVMSQKDLCSRAVKLPITCRCNRPRCRWWLQEGHLSPVIADPRHPGLSLSPGRGVMAEPDYLEGDCDELIKPKKLINPVKNSRNHQDLHRELLMNQKRSEDHQNTMCFRCLLLFSGLTCVSVWRIWCQVCRD